MSAAFSPERTAMKTPLLQTGSIKPAASPLLLKNRYIPTMLGQQGAGSASCRPTPDDSDIKELSHGFMRKLYPYGPIDNRTDGKVSARKYIRLFDSNCIATDTAIPI